MDRSGLRPGPKNRKINSDQRREGDWNPRRLAPSDFSGAIEGVHWMVWNSFDLDIVVAAVF